MSDPKSYRDAIRGEELGNMLDKVLKKKETCLNCSQRVNSGEKGILCDICQRWYHAKCQELGQDDYRRFMAMNTKQVQWYCKSCFKEV